MKKFALLHASALAGAVCVIAATASPASAQAANDTASGAVEEIIVNAQKRAENAQDVPISITALDNQAIAASGVTGVNDLRSAVPALNVTQAVGGFGLPRIRGIGATGQGPSIENPVAVYVDGVYMTSAYATLQDLFDTEQVAVLKGPQGTLFGRNATGGLIQISTLGPQDEWTGRAQVGYGNYQTVKAAAYVAGGVAKGVSLSLAGQYENREDGYGKNLFTGSDVQTARSYAVRGKLKFELGEATTALLNGDIAHRRAVDPAFTTFGLNTLGIDVPAQIKAMGGDPRYDIMADTDPFVITRQKGVSLTLDHDFGAVKLKSISAWRNSKIRSYFDPDGTTVRQLVIDNNQQDTWYTQEINLVSDGEGPFKWVLGGFYMHDKAGSISAPGRTMGLAIAGTVGPAGYIDQFNTTRLNSWSGFAEGTYTLGESTNVTAGIRYTSDKRSLDYRTVMFNSITSATTTIPGTPQNQKFSKPTWRLSVDHRFSPDFMAYASYNRGFRSGAFVTGPTPPLQLKPELVDAYEVGFKSDLLDRRVRLNLAGYYFDQSTVQVMQIISGVQNVFNAKGAKIYGVDGDVSVKITDNLKLFGGFNWNHSRYKSYTDAIVAIPFPVSSTFSTTQYTYISSATGATVANTVCLGTFVPPNITTQAGRDAFYRSRPGGNCLIRGDASHNRLQNTPDFTASMGGSLDIPTSAGTFNLSGNFYHNDGYVGDADGRIRQKAFNTLDASLSWTDSSEHMTLRFWGKNLTKAFYRSQIGASNSGDNGYAGAPRTYGVTLGFDY